MRGFLKKSRVLLCWFHASVLGETIPGNWPSEWASRGFGGKEEGVDLAVVT